MTEMTDLMNRRTPEILRPEFLQEDDDTPHEECGVFGIYAPGADAARLTFFGLFALQHRGQESAGMAISDGETVRSHKEMGLVTRVFDEAELSKLPGHIGIGHTRYSTTGSSVLRNAQPLQCCLHSGTVAVAHNGNLINTQELREEMQFRGIKFDTTNDSEVIAMLIAEGLDAGKTIEEAVRGHDAAGARGVLADHSYRKRSHRRPRPLRRPPALPRSSRQRRLGVGVRDVRPEHGGCDLCPRPRPRRNGD